MSNGLTCYPPQDVYKRQVDDALRTRLAAHFDAQALTELTALIGLQNLSARFNSAMDIPAQGLCRIPEKRS